MKAARYYDRGDIRIEDIPEPKVGKDEVGVKVAWCGICGTDLHEYKEGPIFCPRKGHPHPVSGEDSPVTLGHEFSGVVYEVGEGVSGLKVGQHVVVEPYVIADGVPTGEGDLYHLSDGMGFIGLSGRGGGLSEKVAVKSRWVHPIDKKVPLDQAALIEPLSVGYHAYEISGAKKGDVAVVGGAGPIGLLTAAVLKAEGVKVIITELSAKRKDKAKEAGVADCVLDPSECDVVEEVKKLTGGKGADVVFECSSSQKAVDQLLSALRVRGVMVVVSVWGHSAKIDLQQVVLRELDVRGSIAYCNDHPQTIKLVEEGKIDLKPFITHKINLDDLVSKGFDTLIHHNDTAVKILVSPNEGK